MEIIAYKIIIRGRVTGVCFRHYSVVKAAEFKTITGYIRNRSYSEVETLVQGAPAEVKAFMNWLKHGPPSARVEEFIPTREEPNSNYRSYSIVL